MKHFRYLNLVVLLVGLLTTGLCAGTREVEPMATLAIPAGLSGVTGDTLVVPVYISTFQTVAAAQLTIEFDNRNFEFLTATPGPNAAGFTVTTIFPSPIPVFTPDATENVLLSLNSNGTALLFGNDLNVLLLAFKIVGAAGGASPFTFNPDTTATVLTTDGAVTLSGASLQFSDGSGTIANIATLSIPGGFSVAQAETLIVPIRLSSAKAIGLAQMALEYDESDIKFLEAKVGTGAPGFTIFVETAPSYRPTALGTNKNVLLTLYSGSAALVGAEKTVATLVFLATGGIGGNSPIAFDRRANHTVLSSTDLVDLTGADLDFRDGDATILPPLVSVSGVVFYRNTLTPVSGSEVASIGPSRTTASSGVNGTFTLRKLTQGSYVLRPGKIGDVRGAIQGSDALLVMRAAALLDSLDADQKLSADVTRDGRVTVSDALAILRFLAAQTTGIAQAGTWIFSPEAVSIFVQSNATQNFKTYLLGDVNGNWSSSPNENQMQALPFATVQFGTPRQDGEQFYLPLLAGKEGKVFSLLVSLELPPSAGNDIRFEPATSDIVAVTNYDAKQSWHLALINAAGVAPESKIGEIVLSRAVAENLQNWQMKNSEVNDRRTTITSVNTRDNANTLPTAFELRQNYPNPFNPTTWITFAIPARAGETEMRLEIFTIDGRLVRSLVQGKYAPGTHRVQWDGRDEIGAAVPTGVYFYRIRADKFSASRKLALVK